MKRQIFIICVFPLIQLVKCARLMELYTIDELLYILGQNKNICFAKITRKKYVLRVTKVINSVLW